MRALRPLFGLALALAAGCAGTAAPMPGHEAASLATLPDCSHATVSAAFQASPSSEDGLYVVSDGATPVCATDFDGLQLLDHRLEAPAPGHVGDPSFAPASSDPMPGRGTDPAASDPMPGRGNDPAASDPMPGRGNDPAASDPMPGRGNLGVLHAARELAQ